MSWSAEQKRYFHLLAEEGEVPKALANRPELSPDEAEIFEAFFELSTDRQLGFASGPVPFSAIDRWARRHEIDGAAFDRFRLLIRAMDSAWLEEGERKRERETIKGP